jgi:hypothetical protein
MPVFKQESFLGLMRDALESIREPRFFETERGYQGELLVQLGKRLKGVEFPGDPIVEQEYQKTMPAHGINIRPDIVIHVPFDRGLALGRDEGNFVAIELKVHATENEARGDLANLALMHEILQYPLTVFINIGSKQTHSTCCPKIISNQTICFAVHLKDGEPVVRSERCDQLARPLFV